MAMKRLAQVLVELKMLKPEQAKSVLEEQKRNKPTELMGKIAFDMNLLTEEQLVEALGVQLSMPTVSLQGVTLPKTVLEKITPQMATMYRIVPLKFDEDSLTIAMADPQNLAVRDELRTLLGVNVRGVVASEREVLAAIDRYYNEEAESVESIVRAMENDKDLSKAAAAAGASGATDLTNVEALADSAPVRKLLNLVLLLAIKDHASDIHFEPFEDEFRIRIKADGVLYEIVPPPKHLAFAITTRIKVMANLDIAERRMPQDGRIELTVGGHPVDLRVSVLPTMFGESCVLRVLDRTVTALSLDTVGMDASTLSAFRTVIEKPNGIILVTGPTGSGKTTTLYSALSELNSIEDKLITTEDPVEYDIDGIIQCPIDSSIGVTFASCLRAILRQDPDRILVGEIRDTETAEIAVQASLTGHLVFSTLHTNDAPSTVTRLRDMGVPQFLITATVEAILAQRLVRRICSNCKEEARPTAEQLIDLGVNEADAGKHKFYKGRGCDKCNNTGYKGRFGLFELMIMNDELRDMVMRNASRDELRVTASGYGMVALRDAGIKAAFEGVTTIEEVIRETILEA
jgi:type IV pilus assembly protein PilB